MRTAEFFAGYGVDGAAALCHALLAPPASLAPARLDAAAGLNGVWVIRAWLQRDGDEARHALRVAYIWRRPNSTAAAMACAAPPSSKAARRHAARLAFYLGPMNERGTHVAIYDYADLAEVLLGARTVALLYVEPTAADTVEGSAVIKDGVVAKFAARFPGALFPIAPQWGGYDGESAALVQLAAVNAVLLLTAATHVFFLHSGMVAWLTYPAVVARARPARTAVTCILAVFNATQPHGDRYARISRSVPASTDVAVVPHVVRPRGFHGPNLRAELGIPAGATVFGRHGGRDTFDIAFAHDVVESVSRRKKDTYFVFMNTDNFFAARVGPQPSNVLFVNGTANDAAKSKFVLTCDAMLHARRFGETFGLSVAEFAAHGRPVLTSALHTNGGDARHHLDALGARGIYYTDAATLDATLTNFDRAAARRKAAYYSRAAYDAPDVVMEKFAAAFLDDPNDA